MERVFHLAVGQRARARARAAVAGRRGAVKASRAARRTGGVRVRMRDLQRLLGASPAGDLIAVVGSRRSVCAGRPWIAQRQPISASSILSATRSAGWDTESRYPKLRHIAERIA